MILLAMDRAPSVRSTDADGRLHVATSPISKANICPYYGREIPGWQEMGLDSDRLYQLFRDPIELAKAAPSFNNLPVLSEHVPVTAMAEDSHRPDLVVGSTGTDAAIDGSYLTNSMVIWAKPSIDGVVNNRKRQLSSAYRYRADMTPGVFEGVAYDGVMRDIVGNHVALVFEGRAGPDVYVGDEKPMALKSKRALMLAGGLGGLIRPHLAQDAKFDLGAAITDADGDTIAQDGAARKLGERVFGLIQPHIAQDAAIDLDAVCRVVEAVGGMALDEDVPEMDDEDGEIELEVELKHRDDDKKGPPAMDEKAVQARIEAASADAYSRAMRESAAIRTAESEVRPVVGDLVAMDSAADVYKAGLVALNVDTKGLEPSAFGATFRAVKAARAAVVPIAQDSRPSADATKKFNDRFANRAKLIRG